MREKGIREGKKEGGGVMENGNAEDKDGEEA